MSTAPRKTEADDRAEKSEQFHRVMQAAGLRPAEETAADAIERHKASLTRVIIDQAGTTQPKAGK